MPGIPGIPPPQDICCINPRIWKSSKNLVDFSGGVTEPDAIRRRQDG